MILIHLYVCGVLVASAPGIFPDLATNEEWASKAIPAIAEEFMVEPGKLTYRIEQR